MFQWKQAINSEFSDSPLRLQYFIIVTGAAYFMFAFVIPTLSAMRSWLGVSTILTFTYIAILLLVLVHDGTDILCFQPLSCTSYAHIYILPHLTVNSFFLKGNLTKVEIMRYLEVKWGKFSMPSVQFRPLLFATLPACY